MDRCPDEIIYSVAHSCLQNLVDIVNFSQTNRRHWTLLRSSRLWSQALLANGYGKSLFYSRTERSWRAIACAIIRHIGRCVPCELVCDQQKMKASLRTFKHSSTNYHLGLINGVAFDPFDSEKFTSYSRTANLPLIAVAGGNESSNRFVISATLSRIQDTANAFTALDGSSAKYSTAFRQAVSAKSHLDSHIDIASLLIRPRPVIAARLAANLQWCLLVKYRKSVYVWPSLRYIRNESGLTVHDVMAGGTYQLADTAAIRSSLEEKLLPFQGITMEPGTDSSTSADPSERLENLPGQAFSTEAKWILYADEGSREVSMSEDEIRKLPVLRFMYDNYG